jgi:hypothetical protein
MRGHVQAGCLAVCGVISVACGQGRQTARGPAFVVSPGAISLSPGSWVQFTASIPVIWSLREGDAGGTIDSSGGYTAPASEGLFHLVATGAEEPHQSVEAAISVARSPRIELSIEPPLAAVESGGSTRFTATVTGSSDHDVVWSADAGTIDQSGRYTAPLTAGTFHVVATSRAHPAASATAVVSVGSLSVALSPKTVTLLPDDTQPFTALVAGSVDTRVSWAIVEGAAGGSIDRAGTYTAPKTAGTYHVVAASIADPSSTDTAVVTVADPPGVSVSIVPGSTAVQPGGSIRLSATVLGATDTRVVWTCDKGRIRQDGLYTAPWAEGTSHITAQSLADPSKIAVATLNVLKSDVTLPVEPDQVTVEVRGLAVFRAHLPGTLDSEVSWSIQEGDAGGTIDSLGQYIAPGDHEGVYHVVATSRTDPSKSGTATVTVQMFDLIDHGGNVAASTRTFALWWGDPIAFPPDARTVLESLLVGLDGAAYLGVADEYMRGAHSTTSFGGSLFDSSAPPAENPTESVIADKACRALAANGIANRPGDMVFVISSVFPVGTIPFCAWHYWGMCNGETLLIAYLPNPTGTPCGRMGSGCNAFSPEATALGTFAAHELMETITDPYITAWKDLLGEEIGDKCLGLAACVPLSTGTLQLQPLYSNALHSCVQR